MSLPGAPGKSTPAEVGRSATSSVVALDCMAVSSSSEDLDTILTWAAGSGADSSADTMRKNRNSLHASHLLRASGTFAREQEIEEGAEFLGLAADFLRGMTASMWYASTFPMEMYKDAIRSSMISTNAPSGFSGTQNVEYARMKHAKEHLVETLFNCYGRDLSVWPDPVYNAFKAFHEIDIQDNEHHVLIAISKSGTDKSLAQKMRKVKSQPGKPDRNAADILREMVELKRRKFQFLK